MKYIKSSSEYKISTNLQYHITNGLSLTECVFMIGSDAYCEVINEARELHNKGLIELYGDDLIIVERLKTGTKALFKGDSVILDTPKRGGKKKFINTQIV